MHWGQIILFFILGAFFGPMLLAKLGGTKQTAGY